MAACKELPMFIVDAFSDRPFCGNQAAVCLLENDQVIPDEVKQKLAAEMNLSETAFVSKLSHEDTFKTGQRFRLRWFTPTNEVPLCGHATLATSAVLFHCCGNTNRRLTYETMEGQLFASSKDGKVVLDFPNLAPEPALDKFKDLVKVASCSQPVFDVQISSSRKLLIRLADKTTRCDLEGFKPNVPLMHQTKTEEPVLGVILTVKGTQDYDFFSRYFSPWNGINEDPVTGSAHSVLTPYWAKVLGKTELKARQCSNRGGDLYLKLRDDGRIDIAGDFSLVLKGSVQIP